MYIYIYYAFKHKTCEQWLTRELLKRQLMNRYWSDPEFRNAKNEENKKRAREIVCCAGCKKSMSYGSLGPHKKSVRGSMSRLRLRVCKNLWRR